MKRRVLEEQVRDEAAVDACINSIARAYDLVKRCFMDKDYKRAGLVLGHYAAGLCDVVDAFDGLYHGLSAQYPVDELPSSRAVHVSVAQLHQEFSDFRLEYYNDSDDSHIHECVQERGHELHAKRADEDADEEKRNDSHKDAHRRRTSDPFEQNEDQNCEKQYVEDVSEGHLQKT